MRKRILTAIALLVVALGVVGLALKTRPWTLLRKHAGSASASSSPKPPEVLTVAGLKLRPRASVTTIELLGTVRPNESVVIVSEVARRIVKVRFEDGATVHAGEVLFELDAADLTAKSQELAVKRRLAVETEERTLKAVATGVGSQADSDRARTEREVLDAQLGTLAVDLAKTKLTAPFSGKLGLRAVSVGALVRPGDVLVTLEDTSKLKVDFLVPERWAADVQPGLKFKFKVGGGDAHDATVLAIEPRIEDASRSLRVRGLSDAVAGIVSGSSVSVELPLGAAEQRLYVPSEVVIPSLGGHAVFVASDDGTAKLVEVKVGVRNEREVELVSGVKEGEIVLTDNLLRLRPGAKIKLAGVVE
ncbi:MAG: efflux RND transporter periplasmic adaptor subunit [Polyangiaceae bacterium]